MDRPITGSIEVTPEGWLHIRLDTLLPHCRYGSVARITGAVTELLDRYNGELPHYDKAFLMIDEHSDDDTRKVYDQDNKGWKSVGNALKGRIFDDDDQFTLSICLMAKRSRDACCHIYVLPQHEAYYFFTMHSLGGLPCQQ